MTTTTLLLGNNGEQVRLAKGDLLRLVLEEVPTSGYRWEVDAVSDVLQLEQSGYQNSATGLIGSARCHFFEFRALTIGFANLRLKRWRSWEGESSVTARYYINVTIL